MSGFFIFFICLQTAGLHTSQKPVRLQKELCGSSTGSYTCSVTTHGSGQFSGSTKTTDSDNIDLSLFEGDISEVEYRVQLAQDVTNVENFSPNRNITSNETTDKSKPDLTRENNPIWILLNKNLPEGKRIANLSEDSILNTSEIKTVANIVGEYLFSKADIPKRQVPPSTCLHWSKQYFETLFPQTGAHRFYLIKKESYTTKNGKSIDKGRPSGALYTTLNLLRKKLLQKDESAKLRTKSNICSPSTATVGTPQKVKRATCHRPPAYEDTAQYSPPGITYV